MWWYEYIVVLVLVVCDSLVMSDESKHWSMIACALVQRSLLLLSIGSR